MKNKLATMVSVLLIAIPAIAAEGILTVDSDYDVKETADRLESILKDKGMTIFNRINHSEAGNKVGVDLRETELIIFGNPKVGSPLMKCEQSVAIDLPQKALIWKGSDEKVRISYNDPRFLEKRHAIAGCEEVITKIENALAAISKAAATK